MGKWNDRAREQKLLKTNTPKSTSDNVDSVDNSALNDRAISEPGAKTSKKDQKKQPKIVPEKYAALDLADVKTYEAPRLYADGWEKFFPANNDPDQIIYWKKDGVRIPADPIKGDYYDPAGDHLLRISIVEAIRKYQPQLQVIIPSLKNGPPQFLEKRYAEVLGQERRFEVSRLKNQKIRKKEEENGGFRHPLK